jgi:predicted nucleic acid-binding protein
MIAMGGEDQLAGGAVIDASVAVKWFVRAESTAESKAILRLVSEAQDRRFVVPELFYPELASALKKSREGLGEVDVALEVVEQLPIESVPWHQSPKRMASRLALSNLSAYDALYAAIAIERRLPLLTADLRLARALGTPAWVRTVA